MVWTLAMAVLGCGPGSSDDGDGSSTTGHDTTTGDPPQVSVLEQCEAPAPCDPISRDPGSSEDEIDPALDCAIGQVLATMLEGDVAGVSSSYCDIGCFGTDLFFAGGSSAYLQHWSTTDVTTYEEIQRCTLQAPSFFEGCQGQPWGANGCTNLSDWVMDCDVVDALMCP